ncbi:MULTISPECIES: TetR family transcriptional regulator [unclassified Coleofasciculus]|uniref:TetR family transcriptional regulator n=1 Tax=unclassified Coleofasciculus TaxID=2692782 RepID=UPI00187FEDFE|nr:MULTISPECIES: TetR family transcriptional regulator [unclassified Coleofasciculus]MBE9127766.1 TetR family transcriptional regulator [Coleofasciculus sp. LEGE 07081]MBE9149466.1 TetR family transcriptional regulator [Coleofasciculus sp. LEGE 07092]
MNAKAAKMTSMRRNPQQQRSRERVERILAAAAEVFDEVGYEAATINAIATRAETAIGSLYQFFPDKLAIFHALEERHMQQVNAIHAKLLPQILQQPLKGMIQQVVETFAVYFEQPGPRVVYIQYFVAPEMFVYFGESFTQGLNQKLANVLRLRNPALSVSKSELLAEVFNQCYNSLLLAALRSDRTHRTLLYQEIQNLLVAYLQPYVGDELLHDKAQDSTESCIKSDSLSQKHQLSERQRLALTFAIKQGGLTIQDFEKSCPDLSRRTLQRELRSLVQKGLLLPEGKTNRLYYRLNPLWSELR